MTSRAFSGRVAGFALLTTLALAACETKRTELVDAYGDPAFNFVLATSATGLPSGTATVGATSVTVSAANLRALATGEYEFWLLGRDAQNIDVPTQGFGRVVEFFTRVDTLADGSANLNPVTGDTIFVTDSTIVSDIRTGGYAGSDNPFVTSMRVIIDSTADGSNPATNHAVFLTIESSAASTPGAARFLWRRIGVGGTGAMSFGNFGGSDIVNTVSPLDYVFAARGSGLGGARGGEMSVDVKELARPPVGFFYRGYVVDAKGDGVMVDTLRSSWNADPTVSRVSLYDADMNDLLPEVVGGDIRAAQVRNCATGSAVNNCQNAMDLPATDTFVGYTKFVLKIEPKGGVAPTRNRSITHAGDLPKEVQ
jgi:hypothetical protein